MVEGVLQVNPKIKFNKKGTAASEMWAPDTILFWLFYGIVLGFAAVFFVLIVSKSGSDQAAINEKLYPAFKITLNSQTTNFYSTIKKKNWNDNREFEEKKAPKNMLLYSQNELHNGEIGRAEEH